MKKLFLIAAAAFLSVLTYGLSNAQSTPNIAYHSRAVQTNAAHAKVNSNPKPGIGNTFPITKNEVGIKVARSFLQISKDTAQVDWFKVNNHRYLAYFDVNGKKWRALFERNGSLVYIISTGIESSLPKNVRRQIKMSYIDYSIGTVNEVFSNNQKEWVVNLEDAENLIVVSIINGDLQVLSHYKKSFGKK